MTRHDPVTGRFTAERTTQTTTVTVAERLTIHPAAVPWAPGPRDVLPDEAAWRQQRAAQWQRTWDFLAAAADDGHTSLDPGTLHQAVTMLRALPGATCMEAEHGRTL